MLSVTEIRDRDFNSVFSHYQKSTGKTETENMILWALIMIYEELKEQRKEIYELGFK